MSSKPPIGPASRIGLRITWFWIPWGKRLLAVLLILVMQGPAMLVQEIAWANMLVDYTRERGLKNGVVATFDGEHPCELCLKARVIREDEGKQESPDRPGRELRLRMAWAEMLPGREFRLPGARESRRIEAGGTREIAWSGRCRELPPLPPPEACRSV